MEVLPPVVPPPGVVEPPAHTPDAPEEPPSEIWSRHIELSPVQPRWVPPWATPEVPESPPVQLPRTTLAKHNCRPVEHCVRHHVIAKHSKRVHCGYSDISSTSPQHLLHDFDWQLGTWATEATL